MIEPAREEDRKAVEELLVSCGLPLDGLSATFDNLLVAVDPVTAARTILGSAGLEVHGSHCILRSLAVHPRARGTGVARELIDAILSRARRSGCSDAWLLTRTVEKLAARKGFSRVARRDVPRELLDTTEFAIETCATATVMRKSLQLFLDNDSSRPV